MQRITLATSAGPVAARLWDRAGPAAPWLHFGHATGMHGGLYATRLEHLADRWRILATDARGHGATAALGNVSAIADWRDLAGDLIEVVDQLDAGATWTLAGHSLGAVVAALATVRAPHRVAGLAMIEPAIMNFALARRGGPAVNAMAVQAAGRRPAFADAAAARAAWAGRGVFAAWAPTDLDAYIADALLPGQPARLACTPAFEAMTFSAWPRQLESDLARLARPFVVLAAGRDSTVDADAFAMLAAHPCCRLARRLADAEHFLPLGHWPEVVAALAALPEPQAMASAAS